MSENKTKELGNFDKVENHTAQEYKSLADEVTDQVEQEQLQGETMKQMKQ